MLWKSSLFTTGMGIPLLLLGIFCHCPKGLAQGQMLKSPSTGEIQDRAGTEALLDGGVLTLQKAIALALDYNPDLKASSWEERAMEGRILQAGLLPNPEIEVETEDIGGSGVLSGFNAAETTIQLNQLIELGGKRAKRSASATLTRDLARWDYHIRRADVLARVAIAFVDVLSAQERLVLMKELLHLAEEVFNTTSERVKAGKVSPVEEIKSRVERAARQIDLKQAAFDLQAARRRLSGNWGAAAPQFQEARGDLDALAPIPPLDTLETLISQNPDVARWTVTIHQRIAEIELEKARGIPDLTVSLGAKHHNEMDDTAFVMGVSIPIPLFNRNQGATLEARDRLSQAREEARAVQWSVVNTLAETYQSLSKALMEATALQNEVLPGARAAFGATREGYRLGKFDYLDMLDAQRTLVAARLRHMESLTAYHQARVRMERLIGMNMEEITPGTGIKEDGENS
ncbi:MAG: TolC family protein [Deltaproteobacteria bacterium]|nr:TolC family protein [Deltaproteobacteria bacterium]